MVLVLLSITLQTKNCDSEGLKKYVGTYGFIVRNCEAKSNYFIRSRLSRFVFAESGTVALN